jgi:hypothetical protein
MVQINYANWKKNYLPTNLLRSTLFIVNLSHITIIEGNIIKVKQKQISVSKTDKETLMNALSAK